MDEFNRSTDVDRELTIAASGESPLTLLQRISIREIMALQALVALVVLLDFSVLPAPIGIIAFPMFAALWSAVRLRQFGRLTLVNPFTVTILVTVLTHAAYGFVWNDAVATEGILEDVVSAIVSGTACGSLAAFVALLAVSGWWSFKQRYDDDRPTAV